MRTNINLASQPYEDVRQFYFRWIPALVIGLVITAILGSQAFFRYREYHQLRSEVTHTQQQIRDLDAQKSKAEEVLNSPANAETTAQSRFLNELIARKAFSWTQVMSDLEKIMPATVKVLSIQPQLDASGKLEFRLAVQSSNPDGAIELVRRMESSPQFVSAKILSENYLKEGAGAQFQISSLYVPEPPKAGQP